MARGVGSSEQLRPVELPPSTGTQSPLSLPPTLELSLMEALPWLDYWVLMFPEFCHGPLCQAAATFSPGDATQAYGFPLGQ